MTTPGHFTLGWAAIAGKHYQVQYKPALDASDWINLGGAVQATGNTATLDDSPGSATQRFYRILVQD